MSNQSHKPQQPSGEDMRADRRERLARELRANLLKRKALARARRAQKGNAEPEQEDEKAAS